MEAIVYAAAEELIRQCMENPRIIRKLVGTDGAFIKAKRCYNGALEERDAYLRAVQLMEADGTLRPLFVRSSLTIYQCHSTEGVHTKSSAYSELLLRLERSESILKLHDEYGDYLHAGSETFARTEDERIVFLCALGQLVHKGKAVPAYDCREYAIFDPAPSLVVQEQPVSPMQVAYRAA